MTEREFAPNDEAMRAGYEADIRARMRRGGLSDHFELKRNADGSYRRSDLERDFQTFAESMRRRPLAMHLHKSRNGETTGAGALDKHPAPPIP